MAFGFVCVLIVCGAVILHAAMDDDFDGFA
jgi:hypothetical protein